VFADHAVAPAGVVTFLFTDIEGSTGRWETDADLMRKALAAHDEVLRSGLGRYEPAATIAGFASNPLSRAVFPETSTAAGHVRDVLGNEIYESLTRKGEKMTITVMVMYAYDQIDQARAELDAVLK
jgi:class 3 adenylate cyclase